MWPAMLRVIIIICGFSQANLEMQSFQHHVYISRKSRSNEDPVTTGFVYNKAGEGPGKITTFDKTYLEPVHKSTEIKTKVDSGNNNVTINKNTTDFEENWRARVKDKEAYLSPKQNEEYAKAKTKCLQLKGKEVPGVMDILSTTGIHSELNPNAMKKMFTPYVADREFRIDNEDIRTDSRNTYNGWPYSYKGPYDYQIKHVNTNNEKAKDKRFLGVHTTIAPVRENVTENIPSVYISNAASDPIIDNPIYGDQPFFSFVLNDYFDKHHEEDPLIFKDFAWGEEFDNGLSIQDSEDNERRSRRLHHSNNPNEILNMDMSEMYTKTADKEIVTEKALQSNREYERNQKGDNKKDYQGSNHNYKGNRETAFKDFADSFANKFGSEGRNKNSMFILKTNQDKGEKRKGFKRVYHKDEYQEDNEFYDNTSKNVQSAENGGTNFNVGGSQSFRQAQAVGTAGNEANSLTQNGKKDGKMFKNKYEVNDAHKERDGEINHYRNIAKDAALSNNADYVDNLRI